ncbi:hypothetical protein SADUNF_Sadunf17G0038200 [Salix dunnii]|uniref:Uncharacterized protein n=1 Tax=Salix dunnii TaxID=1413687 RepID=A0A835MEL5_9ROSI|nr:hypothetical protein SADUNF_Sadunf17G0038200 [Salix dunnii]
MGSDGIRCISAGMIAPISSCRMKCYKQSSMIPQQREVLGVVFLQDLRKGAFIIEAMESLLAGSLDFQDVIPRPRLSSDGIRCISAGMIAPISTCRMKCYKQSSMIPQQRGEAARRCIFTGVSVGCFPGSLDFQDVIPRPRLRDEISRGGAEKAWLDLSAGGIKSGAGRGGDLYLTL